MSVDSIRVSCLVKQYDTDLTGYAEFIQDIINEILQYQDLSKELYALQTQLDLTRQAIIWGNMMLDQVLAKKNRSGDVVPSWVVSYFQDFLIFNSNLPEKLRS